MSSTCRITRICATTSCGGWRIPQWNPPCLYFDIERHGATVNGSSRAAVYTWEINLDEGTASVGPERRRQLYPMDKRLDVKPIAKSLAEAIIKGKADARLKRSKDGTVRLNISEIIPATNKETITARRNRLRSALDAQLRSHGWVSLRANVYQRTGVETETGRPEGRPRSP